MLCHVWTDLCMDWAYVACRKASAVCYQHSGRGPCRDNVWVQASRRTPNQQGKARQGNVCNHTWLAQQLGQEVGQVGEGQGAVLYLTVP